MQVATAAGELERQLDALVVGGLPTLSGVSESDFRTTFEPLVPQIELWGSSSGEGAGSEGGNGVEGAVPFVVIPSPNSVDAAALVPRLTLLGKDRPGVLDRNHGDTGVSDYRPLPELAVPPDRPYVLVGVQRGEEFCDVRPRDAVEVISTRGRSPLTILEGVVLQLVYPELLQTNRCFMLAGSRRGDKRVPALWISNGAPKLGWCWEGNPHSWLGIASAEARLTA